MQDKKLRTVKFKAACWSCEDTDDNECIIHLSGITEEQKTVQVKVSGFTPFVYLELPSRIKWDQQKCKSLYKYFRDSMKIKGPVRYNMYGKYRLHYKKLVNTMFMSFLTGKACRDIGNKCRNARIYLPGIGTINPGELKVHEQNIDPILKLTAAKKLPLAGWIYVTEKTLKGEENLSEEARKFSSADIDLYADFNDIQTCEMEEEPVVKATYCSFDIECLL